MQLSHTKFILIALFILQSNLKAQVTLVLNEPMRSDFSYSAIKKISLTSGFSTGAGTNYDFSASVLPTPPSGWYEPAQPTGAYNYMISSSPRIALTESFLNSVLAGSDAVANSELVQEIAYFDGLGRPKQEISVASAPDFTDVVQFHTYDGLGRENINYLPFNANEPVAGAYVASASTKQNNFYNSIFGATDGASAKAEITFEASPLNRVEKKSAPGDAWKKGGGHETSYQYTANTSAVKKWTAGTALGAITGTQTYAAGNLWVSQVTDENQSVVREYKNRLGQVVLKEVELNESTQLQTYYVYDDFGLLRAVIPPKANGAKNDSLCYYYRYDNRQRMIEKQIPGASVVYMVYDKRNRLVAIQDGNMRAVSPNKWLLTKYDALNRPVLTAEYSETISRDALQTRINGYTNEDDINVHWIGTPASTNLQGYSKDALGRATITSNNVLTATYYDEYHGFNAITGLGPIAATTTGLTDPVFGGMTASYSLQTQGMVTATRVRNLDTPSANYLTVNYYDDKGRLTQSVSQTHINASTFDRTFMLYDFTNAVTATLHQQGTVREAYRYEYDHRGRLVNTLHQIPTKAEVLMASQTYNKLGQASQKKLHAAADGTNAQQTIDYSYNIRGWLTGINDPGNLGTDLFAMNLMYNNIGQAQGLTSQANYNGNISAVLWKDAFSNTKKGYGYNYDQLNRLTKANYGDNINWNSMAFDEGGEAIYGQIQYDYNGNILTMNRNNSQGIFMDKMKYFYAGNQLIDVVDAGIKTEGFIDEAIPAPASEYTYDANGNLTRNYDKGLDAITYNLLNLPKSITKGAQTLQNAYSAAGAKLRNVYNGITTDYVGNFVYENNVLIYILTPEGRLIVNGSNYSYEYHLRDHLGNTRVAFTANAGGTLTTSDIVQVSDYYSFGLRHQPFAKEQADQKYLYNGKEMQDGTDWLDYGARMYDPSLGRWHCVDPMAESYESFSPYHMAGNNPILFLDENGMDYYSTNDPDQIRAIWLSLQHGGSSIKNHDFSSWEVHASDEEFISRMSYNTETGKWFISIPAYSEDGANSVLGLFFDGLAPNSDGKSNEGIDWEELSDQADDFLLNASMVDAHLPFGDMLGLVAVGGVRLGKLAFGSSRIGGLWKLTQQGASQIKNHKTWGTIYKSSSDGLWWAIDKTAHGTSKFKVFKETKNGLVWYKDADQFGNFILNKHKSKTGTFIPWGQLKTVK